MSIFLTTLSAFAAGMFGSAAGALISIVMCALTALSGIGTNVAGAYFNLIDAGAFGILLGPHVSFAPACCALDYAWRKGYLNNSRDLITPLISLNHPDVLLVGGLFGVGGWYMNLGLSTLFGGRIDSVAMTITLLSLIAKWLFGGSPIGRIEPGKTRFGANSEVWLGWQTAGKNWNLMLLGVAVSVLSGGLTIAMCQMAEVTGNSLIADAALFPLWALGLIQLLFLASKQDVPIFHHIGLCSAMGAKMAVTAGAGELGVTLWAVALGVMAAYTGDLLGKLFHVNGPGYVDPPSAAIAVSAPFALWFFPLMGADRPDSLLHFLLPVAVILLFALFEVLLQRSYRKANA